MNEFLQLLKSIPAKLLGLLHALFDNLKVQMSSLNGIIKVMVVAAVLVDILSFGRINIIKYVVDVAKSILTVADLGGGQLAIVILIVVLLFMNNKK